MEKIQSGELSFTVGLPRSGKSTYVNKWVKTIDPDGLNRVVVNQDNIRLAVSGERYNSYIDGMIKEITWVMIKSHLLAGSHVLYDETNTSIKSIRKMYELHTKAKPIPIFCNKEVCIQRAIESSQEDLIPAIERMYKNLSNIWNKYQNMNPGDFLADTSFLWGSRGYFQSNYLHWKLAIEQAAITRKMPPHRIVK